MTWLKATVVLVAGVFLGACASTGGVPTTAEHADCSPPGRVFTVASADVEIADAADTVWRGPSLAEGRYAVLMEINGGTPGYTGFGTGVGFSPSKYVPVLYFFNRDPRSEWYEEPLPKHESKIAYFEVATEDSPTTPDDEWYQVFAPGAENWFVEVWRLADRSGSSCRSPELTSKSEFPSRP